MRLKGIIILLLLGIAYAGFAQSIKKVHGEYIYHAPENVSLEQAKQTALSRAQIQALADEFGTIVSQHNATMLNNSNGKSSTDFTSLSSSDVKGEWLETLGTPQYNINFEGGMLVVKCSVSGKARELVAGKSNFVAKVLRNGTNDRFESYDFKSGDDLFLSYQTSAKGYIAVYLVDQAQNAYCLLPYQSSTDGKVQVEANKPYIFFSSENSQPLFYPNDVDEYKLTCKSASETNYIYVISSPHPFVKAIDKANEGLPRELSFADFQKWLSKNRTQDKDMQVDIKTISITQ